MDESMKMNSQDQAPGTKVKRTGNPSHPAALWIRSLLFSIRYPLFALLVSIKLMIPPALHSQTYLSKTYTVTDGLASPTINDITQDMAGRMWFATPVGITSYDGTTWKHYSPADGLPSQHYSYIRADNRGNIWAFTRYLRDGGYFFDGKHQQWKHIDKPAALAEDPASIAAVALLENTGDVYLGIGTKKSGFYIYTKEGWSNAGQKPGVSRVLNVDCDNRRFYLVTDSTKNRESNLLVIRPDQPQAWTVKDVKVPAYPVYSLSLEQFPASSPSPNPPGPVMERPIWLAGTRWVGYYYRERFHLLYRGDFPGFRPDTRYKEILTLPDAFGGLWVGNDRVLFNVDKRGHLKILGMPENFPSMGANSLFFDRESNLWIGTHRGILKIISFYFENYRKKDGLFDNEVTAIAGFGQEDMVFGHNGGFTFFIANRFYPVEIQGGNGDNIFDKRVMDLCRDRQGNTWAAVAQRGIARLNHQRQIKWYLQNPQGNGDFTSVLCDNSGQLWVSAHGVIFKWENHRFIPFKTDKKIRSYIRRLFNGNENTLFIATGNQGLFRLEGNRLNQFRCPVNEDANSVFSVHTGKNGTVLVGTQVGLFSLENDTLVKFRRSGFQVDIPVYFIDEDQDGYLWFGLNNGVIKWDGSDGNHARHYTFKDGLAGNETNRGASFLDHHGRFWIGTESGVSCYYRERDRKSPPPPLLELLYLETRGSQYPLDRDLSLKYLQDDLTFHFRGISFIDETALRYNLKLDGVDQQWLTGFRAPNNQIRYLNVPAGNYRFYIQAVNNLGIKSPILSSGAITIEKPFFRTLGFYLLVALSILLLIFLIANFITKKQYALHLEEQIHQRSRQLEASEKELRNIFNNAHDAILVIDPQSEIVYNVNQRGCEIYGFSREEFIGMSLETISKDVRRGKKKINETLQAGECLTFESVQYRKDGSEMFLEINASVINYRGNIAILSINRDNTQRKLAELQIKKSLQEKETLLKEIHHRVKNNLQVISSLLDLQSETLEDPEIIDVFRNSTDRIRSMALVHENLYRFGDLARINGSEYIHKLVEYFFDTYGNLAGNIIPYIRIETPSLSLDMDTAIPLGLILTELLSNALKHAFPSAQAGEIHIHVRSGPAGMLTVDVRDNGIGFPQDFDLQGSKSLGMQLVTLLTQQVKGTLDLKVGKGTTVTVTIPYKETGDAARKGAAAPEP
jgi:PAS domain S-box-containing protein